MRIASLVPSATEMLFALGLGENVVAVTHACDHPPDVAALPQLTTSVIPADLAPADVDSFVRGLVAAGEPLHTLDVELLKEEEPDLIVTQQLCTVCTVPIDAVRAAVEDLDPQPRVLSLDAATLGEVLGDIGRLATAAGEPDAGEDLVNDLADRIDAVTAALESVGGDGPQPVTVAALEWLEPPFIAGRWVPQMIEMAGGLDLLGMPGEPSREAEWSELKGADPEVLFLMQCGYDAAQSAEEAEQFAAQLRELTPLRIVATNANAYFGRPGPRLIDGLELLADALHPGLAPEPAAGAMLELELG